MTNKTGSACTENYSVCGLIVLTYPQSLSSVKQALSLMPGVEIYCCDDVSKLVLMIEEEQRLPPIPWQIDQIRELSGVADVSMAYSHTE